MYYRVLVANRTKVVCPDELVATRCRVKWNTVRPKDERLCGDLNETAHEDIDCVMLAKYPSDNTVVANYSHLVHSHA